MRWSADCHIAFCSVCSVIATLCLHSHFGFAGHALACRETGICSLKDLLSMAGLAGMLARQARRETAGRGSRLASLGQCPPRYAPRQHLLCMLAASRTMTFLSTWQYVHAHMVPSDILQMPMTTSSEKPMSPEGRCGCCCQRCSDGRRRAVHGLQLQPRLAWPFRRSCRILMPGHHLS